MDKNINKEKLISLVESQNNINLINKDDIKKDKTKVFGEEKNINIISNNNVNYSINTEIKKWNVIIIIC